MPYKSLPLGAFWTIFGRNFPTGVLQLLYPYQPANPLVDSIFKALNFPPKKKSSYVWATERTNVLGSGPDPGPCPVPGLGPDC